MDDRKADAVYHPFPPPLATTPPDRTQAPAVRCRLALNGMPCSCGGRNPSHPTEPLDPPTSGA